MGLRDRMADRRERRQRADARGLLMKIAADVYDVDDTEAEFDGKMRAAIAEATEDRPFLKLLMELLMQLLPMLFKMMAGT